MLANAKFALTKRTLVHAQKVSTEFSSSIVRSVAHRATSVEAYAPSLAP